MNSKRINAIAARALAWLLERHPESGTGIATDGEMEVVIVYRPRKEPAKDDLKAVHKKLLEVLTDSPQSARTLCRKADYALGSLTLVQQGLSDLIELRRVVRTRDGYAKSTL